MDPIDEAFVRVLEAAARAAEGERMATDGDGNPYRLAIPTLGVHVVGPLADGVQRCARCGTVITEKAPGEVGFPVGSHVEVYGGNPRYKSLTPAAATCLEAGPG